MQARKFVPLTTKELRPQGWLKRQLEIQAEGLSGHLDLIWPDIRDSKWIGGGQGRLGEGAVLAGWIHSAGLFAGR